MFKQEKINEKSAIMKTYDFSKGGTDIVDERMNSKKFSTKAISKK